MSCCAMLKRIFGAQGEPVLDVGRQYKLGKYMVTVVEVIAQGGFAIVYKVETEDTTPYALKVVRLHDQESLDVTAREIEVMRLLSGHANTVKLFAADMRPNGRFTEQLILMEYCPGGHVIGIMNRRLQRRFNEAEVLKIFSDTCLGVAALHQLEPPIIHRDIKLENVLLGASNGSFKLCDFGSCTTKSILPGTDIPVALVEEELGKYTTLQYRAPEMVDLYCNHRITTKADMWAMGCLLYKLCFFEDAFGDSSLSIISGKFRIPEEHAFSTELIDLIRGLLVVNPDQRLDIFAATSIAFHLRGLECPLHTIVAPPAPAPAKAPLPTRQSESAIAAPPAPSPGTPRRAASSVSMPSAARNPFLAAGSPAAPPAKTPNQASFDPFKQQRSETATPTGGFDPFGQRAGPPAPGPAAAPGGFDPFGAKGQNNKAASTGFDPFGLSKENVGTPAASKPRSDPGAVATPPQGGTPANPFAANPFSKPSASSVTNSPFQAKP
eukprot:m.44084 g.44084  ORF g.44084 m.44084 type:complete len:495 (+) comp5812_c0_seq2:102-1586(+)